MINFPFGTNGKSIILGVPIFKHITLDLNKMSHYEPTHMGLLSVSKSVTFMFGPFKGRFLKFRRYHSFANLFSKLSETTVYQDISKFQ